MTRDLQAARFHGASRVAGFVILALLMAAPGAPAGAQRFRIQPAVQPEVRAFVSVATDWSAGAGIGANVPAGYYLRVAPMLSVGRRLEGEAETFARVEVVGRFSLDPFRESRWGPWAGAGLAAEWERGARGRGLVMLALGTDLPGTAGWRPSVELALGGGARLALAFKPVRRAGR